MDDARRFLREWVLVVPFRPTRTRLSDGAAVAVGRLGHTTNDGANVGKKCQQPIRACLAGDAAMILLKASTWRATAERTSASERCLTECRRASRWPSRVQGVMACGLRRAVAAPQGATASPNNSTSERRRGWPDRLPLDGTGRTRTPLAPTVTLSRASTELERGTEKRGRRSHHRGPLPDHRVHQRRRVRAG